MSAAEAAFVDDGRQAGRWQGTAFGEIAPALSPRIYLTGWARKFWITRGS